MYYRVTLINNSENDAYADIVWLNRENTYTVVSNNDRLKANIEAIISRYTYTLSPGANFPGYASDGVTLLEPGTPYYFEALPEILGWRGLRATYHGEAHKSMNINYIPDFTLKNYGGYTYTNDEGHTIVKIVPQGYIAINDAKGKYLTAGQWLNADLDKEPPDWRLEENPYDSMSPEEREEAWYQYEDNLREGELGMDPSAYGIDVTEENAPDLPDYYRKGEKDSIALRDYFVDALSALQEVAEARRAEEEEKESAIPDYYLPEQPATLFCPALRIAVDSDVLPEVIDQLQEEYPDWQKRAWYATQWPPTGKYTPLQKARNWQGEPGTDPRAIPGTDKGLVRVHTLAEGEEPWRALTKPWRMTQPPTSALVNLNERPGVRDDTGMYSPQQVELRAKVKKDVRQFRDNITTIVGRSAVYDTEKAKDVKVDGLFFAGDDVPDGKIAFQGNLEPGGQDRWYQPSMVASVCYPGQYERFGGPKGAHGHMLRAIYGVGKTATTIMSWLTFRNRGVFKGGQQTLLVTAPKKMIETWGESYKNFTPEDAIVISGTVPQRIEQWRQVFQMAKDGELPGAIIVASSAFRKDDKDVDDDDPFGTYIDDDGEIQDTEVLGSMEHRAMRLLALGGTWGEGDNQIEVKGGHIGLFAIDETGQFPNTATNRTKLLWSLIDDIEATNGLTLTLNGDISGNGAQDTISELSFINRMARGEGKYSALINTLTAPFRDEGKVSKQRGVKGTPGGNRRWTREGREVISKLFTNITNVSGEFIAGAKFGLNETDPVIAEMGANWGDTYNQAHNLLMFAFNLGGFRKQGEEVHPLVEKAMGLQSILQSASYGATHPARLVEYNIGVDKLLATVATKVSAERLEAISNKLKAFQSKMTDDSFAEELRQAEMELGMSNIMIPNTSVDAGKRAAFFEEVLGKEDYDIVTEAIEDWDAPALDEIVDGVYEEITSGVSISGKNKKIGVGGFSRRAIDRIHKRLVAKFDNDKHNNNVMIQVINGDTSAADTNAIQNKHQAEKDKHVITLVTSAAKYGVSLPADRSWKFPSWNPATARQMTARFHRDPFQSHLSTTVLTGGMTKFMMYMSQMKDQVRRDLEEVFEGKTEALRNAAKRRLEGKDAKLADSIDEDAFLEALEHDSPTLDTGAIARMKASLESGEYKPVIRAKERHQLTAKQRTAMDTENRERRAKLTADARSRKEKEAAEFDAALEAKRKADRAEARRKKAIEAREAKAAAAEGKTTKKSVPTKLPRHIRRYDKPTLTRNPFYREEDQ